jgi:hypothetical protein
LHRRRGPVAPGALLVTILVVALGLAAGIVG